MTKRITIALLVVLNALLLAALTRKTTGAPQAPWSRLFSTNLNTFVANLRKTNCPEETVRDIAVAEVTRRFSDRQALLHPHPQDHIPFGWPRGSAFQLEQRRREARALARQKAAALRQALGYDVPVDLPQFALSAYDLRFETAIASLPVTKHAAVRAVDDHYWAEAEALEERVKGFWEPGDFDRLQRLKEQRRESLHALLTADELVEFSAKIEQTSQE